MSLEDLRKRLRQNRRGLRRDATRTGLSGADGTERQLDDLQLPSAEAQFNIAIKEARAAQEQILKIPENMGAKEQIDSIAELNPGFAQELCNLDPWQLSAVLNSEPALLLRAQVGSGKTRVLVTRVLKALFDDAVSERPILVMTFTNRAAREIRDRVMARAGTGAFLARLRIGTFHSLCAGLLREYLKEEEGGRTRHFRLLHERARLQLLRELIESEGLRISYQSKLERRLELFHKGQLRFGNMKQDDDIADLNSLYEARKSSHDLVDFDDLIALGRSAAAAIATEERPSHMIVDEFQDTDPAQLDLLEAWRGPMTQLFAVGDPDQVIYSWRGGSGSIFDDFQERFGAAVQSLPRNYRSTATILEAARFLLGPAAGSHHLHASREEGSGLKIIQHHDVVAEALHIANELPEYEGKSVAVLVRTRDQMEPLREHLEQLGVELHVHEKAKTEDSLREWLFDFLSFLSLGLPMDLVDRVLGHRQFGFEGLKGRQLRSDAAVDCEEMLATVFGHDRSGLEFLMAVLEKARQALRLPQRDAACAFDALQLGYFLEPRSSRYESRQRRVMDWLEGLSWPGENWVMALVDQLSLVRSAAKVRPQKAQVELMTMHAAKGLEFDCVYLSGVNRGMIPLAASWGDAEKEAEERRLLFVAMTRARDRLQIGWFSVPPRRTVSAEPSAWLSLIPERLLDSERPRKEDVRELRESPFGAGVAVKHPRYGKGIVLAVENGQLRCLFGARGEKRFFLAACPLTISDD